MLSTLFTSGLDAYLAENADSADDFWLFQHIPKTAGSALRTQLFRALKPSVGIDVKNIDPTLPLEDRRAEATRLFLQRLRKQSFRCAGGHIMMPDVLRILHHAPHAKLITFLRDPVERVISDFVYFRQERMENARPGDAQLFASFEGFVNHAASQNKMARFLSPDRPMTDAQLMRFIERRFTFVGIQDRYAQSVALLGKLIGVEFDAAARVRDSVQAGAEKPVLSAADRDDIAAKNPRDVYLFQHFSERLAPYL